MIRRSWRSWFWNLVLAALMLVFAGIFAGMAVTDSLLPTKIISSIGFVLFFVACIRSLLMSVSARDDGIVIRRLTNTIRIPWREVESITDGPLGGSAAGLVGAAAPTIRRRSTADRATSDIELNVLGSYGILRKGQPADAVKDLNLHLAQWKRNQKG